MSLKWKEIEILVKEALPLLRGSSIQKISQVKELAMGESFALQGFGSAGHWRLWVCLQQDQTVWVLADEDWVLDSQPEPTTFVMVLRKHLIGNRIQSIEQVAGERFVLFHMEKGQSLLFELLPKKANMLLLENWDAQDRSGKCIQSFRKVSLEAGALYRLRPPPEKVVADDIRAAFQMSAEAPYPFHRVVGEHYWQAQQKGGLGAYKRLWRQSWKTFSKRIATALSNTKTDLEEAKEAELFQKRGMALVSELYQLGARAYPKEKKIILQEIEIPLDPSKTYSENSEVLFKKAKKFHRAVGELEGRLKELEEKQKSFEEAGKKIEAAESEGALEALTSFFEKEGIPVPEKPTGLEEKKASEAKLYLEVRSSDGFSILCGRNQEENRQVTFRESRGSDIWMHVKGVPGAHVVVKAQKNKSVPLNTLLEAAQVCLYYSKIRKGKRAEVDYTPRKNVKAIKGTLAEVTYTGNKALYVEADPEMLKKLLRT
jgi:predicted ribosome quality control (RQC) complex YloA/Tae2 family protein